MEIFDPNKAYIFSIAILPGTKLIIPSTMDVLPNFPGK